MAQVLLQLCLQCFLLWEPGQEDVPLFSILYIAGLLISQTSCPDIFQEGGVVYMVTCTNLTGQVVILVGQMPKLTGKCPVTDC